MTLDAATEVLVGFVANARVISIAHKPKETSATVGNSLGDITNTGTTTETGEGKLCLAATSTTNLH